MALVSSPRKLYFDYNATTPLAPEVVESITRSLVTDWGNPCSGNPFSVLAKASIFEARIQVAEMVQCSPSDVIFMSGGTEANNTVVYNVTKYFEDQKKIVQSNKSDSNNSIQWATVKPHIITSNVEHPSIALPIQDLENHGLATVTEVEVNSNGCVNPESVLGEITDFTCLITIMYANNETGVIMPIPEIGRHLVNINAEREKEGKIKILFHTDAAQAIGKIHVNFELSNVDFLTIVGHKFYGPRIGCLCAKTQIHPLMLGGGQENGLRPGTENTPMIVGLGVAAKLVKTNLEKYKNHMKECRDRLESRLREVFGDAVVVNCRNSYRLPNTSNISFKRRGLEGSFVLSRCNSLIASVGSACHTGKNSQVLINSKVPFELARNAIRLSVGRDTTFQDVDDMILDLQQAVMKTRSVLSSSHVI